MPRVKRAPFRRRRRTFRRRRAPLKAKIQAVVTRTLRRSEPLRYVDEYATSQALTTAATFTNLSDAIAQGDGVGDRNGDRINIRRINSKFTFIRDPQATVGLCACRVILFKWFPDTSADPPAAGTDIIYDQTNDFVQSPITMYKINRRKFAVVRDWYFNLAIPSDGQSVKTISLDYRPKGRMGLVDYTLAGGAHAKGHYFLVTFCNQSSAGTEGATVRYHTTLHFEP